MSCGSAATVKPAPDRDAPHIIAREVPPEVNKDSPFSVQIPNSGKSRILESAFAECTGLTAVDIPESITHIGPLAFYGCTSLTSVVIPEGVTRIGPFAFCHCTGLISIVIHAGVIQIDLDAFQGCTALISVLFADGVAGILIGDGAFSACRSLTSIVLPEGVARIGTSAFSECTGLTSVVLPSSVTEIGHGAFSGCAWLVVVRLIGGLNRVEFSPSAFAACSHLSLVVAPRASGLVGATFVRSLQDGVTVVANTETNRRRAVDLQYWRVQTHHRSSASRRQWVHTVLLIANRLRGAFHGLPREMWYMILESIRRPDLGPTP
jgi:hypothetical protein